MARQHALQLADSPGQAPAPRLHARHRAAHGFLTSREVCELLRFQGKPPLFAIELGKLLVETFGALDTPAARLRVKARELRETAAELDSLAEYVA